jgi:anti-anti-sigma regulatory factor
VYLRGALDATSGERLLDSLRSTWQTASVEIDLTCVTSVDRAGATLLLDACVATLLRRRAFVLSGPSAACRRSLERFGVLTMVPLIETHLFHQTSGSIS